MNRSGWSKTHAAGLMALIGTGLLIVGVLSSTSMAWTYGAVLIAFAVLRLVLPRRL